jgi:uncharacterized protein YpiB (UPF0302 family)
MAGIDKMYWTMDEYNLFMKWFFQHFKIDEKAREILNSIGTSDHYTDNIYAVTNFRERTDKYLKKHCDLKFVQKRLTEQYDGEI